MSLSIGLDIGYSSVKLAVVDATDNIIFENYRLHKGKVRDALLESLKSVLNRIDANDITFAGVTGSGSRFLSATKEIATLNEVASIVEGSLALNREIKSIIDIGGQSAKYITDFSENERSHTKLSMNTSCSAGTGSFLEEQVSRLNLKLDDYSEIVKQARSIPRIAGRCSVFAKTDIIHHQQEGVSVADILLGLAYAVIRNYKGAVMRKLPLQKPIYFAGGVARNQGIIRALNDTLKLDPGELIINDHFSTTAAVGAAILSRREEKTVHLGLLLAILEDAGEFEENRTEDISMPSLEHFGRGSTEIELFPVTKSNESIGEACYLGIDVGSTSTNLVAINRDNKILAFRYLKTLGDPMKAVEKGFAELKTELGRDNRIEGVGVTGSGRYLIGNLIGADVIKDEISAQAKAAGTIDPEVDTIFEIGGQDSKYIGLKNGVVADFQMNKICAAGTGSFLEEQANKFSIPIDQFGNLALSAKNPINLGERCTVFIETSIASSLSRGAKIEDIAAGLCYSVARNYLTRVVGQKPVGDKVFFQGGVAHNLGVVNAFKALIGDKLIVPPYFSVTGAYGAAIMAKEEMLDRLSQFKGFDFKLRNQFEAERREKTPNPDHKREFGKKIEAIVFEDYDGSIDPARKTVGIPRALFTYGMFPLFNTFFRELGFNVLLSDASSEYTIGLGQEYALDETCYPVKLINGHVAELVQKKVDYIFFPDLYTVDHPGSESRLNFGCAYMQLAFKVVNRAMDLEKQGIELLAPTIAFSLGQEFMKNSFGKLGKQLGKTTEETNKALQQGMRAILEFEERLENNAHDTLKSIRPDEKVFVLLSKIYGVADPVLNMGIPEKLMDMGYKVIPFFQLPEVNVSAMHPNMFWPFGQHILEPARLIKEHPNLYAIFLTHHGCGPDSVFSHYFREIMDGKPYLYVEVDEHSSSVGVTTRVEAFINSLEEVQTKRAEDVESYTENLECKPARIFENIGDLPSLSQICLPYLYPYSRIFEEMLTQNGFQAVSLPRTSKKSCDAGRKFTITEEYFSLTALLGDIFYSLDQRNPVNGSPVFLLPQTEGAEVEGQYSRLVRTKLDEEDLSHVELLSPFLEDFPGFPNDVVRQVWLGLIAGDLILNAPRCKRNRHLSKVIQSIRDNRLNIDFLELLAIEIFAELRSTPFKKSVLAVGEIFVLYNDFLNDHVFDDLENQNFRIGYAPLSEYLWAVWRDYADDNPGKISEDYRQNLDRLKELMGIISYCLAEESPFEAIPDNLIGTANKTIGYYAGAGGRYREAKLLTKTRNFDGILNVFSMYENTGITLNVLHKAFENENNKPVLNLTFDGNKNENDKTRIESFLYYL